MVREVFRLYTEEQLSIAAVVRTLNERGVPTRSKKCLWERSTVWQMLKNPAYKGMAAFGKTESCPRKKITRRLRQKGGFSPRDSANRQRPQGEWIFIPVPAIIRETPFALAQDRLQKNKQLSPRNTKEPSLLQSILICRKCGYAMYRTSTRTSKRRIYYYRCIGSDNDRHAQGRVCDNRPIRQDYLDELVWDHLLQTLSDETLVRTELDRRAQHWKKNGPLQQRERPLMNELKRIQNAVDRLLDAYQEGLIDLPKLRQRMPELKKREAAVAGELRSIKDQAIAETKILEIETSVESFRSYLLQAGTDLTIQQKQKLCKGRSYTSLWCTISRRKPFLVLHKPTFEPLSKDLLVYRDVFQ